jgi:hypothetical protein
MKKLKNEFTMLFDNLYDCYYTIKSNVARNVLMHLIRTAEYKRNRVCLTKANREEICSHLQIDNPALSRALNTLKDKKIIGEMGGNIYLNPLYVWKGNTRIREKVLKIISDEVLETGEEISFVKILANDQYL